MSKMFRISLPDGTVREVPEGATPADVAAAIGPGLAKAALAARVDGEVRDIMRPFEGDASLALITARDERDALELVRHDFAHVLAEAVQALYPGTQVTFGPATDDGFYYDFHRDEPFSTDDFAAIEKEMSRIVDRDAKFEREVWDRDEAITFFEARGEAFKAELIRDLKDPRVGLLTIHAVDVTADYAHATIFFSLLIGDPHECEAALNEAAGYLRNGLFKRLQIHTVPTLHFHFDRTTERAADMNALIAKAVSSRATDSEV